MIKLCKALEIDDTQIQKELDNYTNLKIEIEKFKDAYIFVNTNFKRKSEPIFALAFLESKRRISLYKNEKYLFKSRNEILNIISNEIIKDYVFNNGKLFIWGDIVNYQVHLFNEIYTFETNGKLTNIKENYDVNVASLKLK